MECNTGKALVAEYVLNTRFPWPTFKNEQPRKINVVMYKFVKLDLEYFNRYIRAHVCQFLYVLPDLFR